MKKKKYVKNFKTGFWLDVRNKIGDSKDDFLDHQYDFIKWIIDAKDTTKVFVVSAFLVIAVIGGFSLAHSFNTVHEKEKEYADLLRQIEVQKEENRKLEDEIINGDRKTQIEEDARDKLDMVYPDEQVFINNAG